MESKDTLDQARALTAGVARRHRVDLPRDWRRRAIPSRSARPEHVHIAVCPGGIWLDVTNKAGVLFSVEAFAQFAMEAVATLVEATPEPESGA